MRALIRLLEFAWARNVNMVAGLLGILKTGAAYVPLDPAAFQRTRLAFMMDDAKGTNSCHRE